MEASSVWAPVIVLVATVACLLTGRLLGRALPTATPWVLRLLLGVLLTALGVAGAVATSAVSLWDLVGCGVVVSVGLASSALRGREVAAGVAGLAVFLLVTEGAGRIVLPDLHMAPDPPWLLTPGSARTVTWDACELMFPSLAATTTLRGWRTQAVSGDAPVVLHLGDSMLVFGERRPGQAMENVQGRFVEGLAAADPAHRHLNLGQPGSALDVAALALDTWAARFPVAHVVVYFFADNDLSDLDRRYPCCRGGLLFDYGATAEPRCADADPPLLGSAALQDLLFRGGPPLVVRVASRWSPVWRHVRARLDALAQHGTPWGAALDTTDDDLARQPEAMEEAWRRYRLLLEHVRADTAARGVGMTVVNLPVGPVLSRTGGAPAGPAWERSRRLAALCDTLGIRHLDAWEAFEDEPAQDAWFLDDGFHLSTAGHARLEGWLEPRLLPLLGEAPPG